MIVFSLLLLMVLLPLIGTQAYAKGPNFDLDYTFGQSFVMIILPAVGAASVLVMISLYTGQNQTLHA